MNLQDLESNIQIGKVHNMHVHQLQNLGFSDKFAKNVDSAGKAVDIGLKVLDKFGFQNQQLQNLPSISGSYGGVNGGVSWQDLQNLGWSDKFAKNVDSAGKAVDIGFKIADRLGFQNQQLQNLPSFGGSFGPVSGGASWQDLQNLRYQDLQNLGIMDDIGKGVDIGLKLAGAFGFQDQQQQLQNLGVMDDIGKGVDIGLKLAGAFGFQDQQQQLQNLGWLDHAQKLQNLGIMDDIGKGVDIGLKLAGALGFQDQQLQNLGTRVQGHDLQNLNDVITGIVDNLIRGWGKQQQLQNLGIMDDIGQGVDIGLKLAGAFGFQDQLQNQQTMLGENRNTWSPMNLAMYGENRNTWSPQLQELEGMSACMPGIGCAHSIMLI